MLQAARPPSTTSGPRRLQRDPERDPAGRRARDARRLLRGRLRPASRPTRSAPTSANLGEYGIADRIYELSQPRGPDRPGGGRRGRRRRTGRAGCSAPSGRAPSCRRSATSRFAALRDAYQAKVAGLIDGGADAILVETAQDLLQAKAAVIGAKRAHSPRPASSLPRVSSRSRSRPPARCCSAPRSAPR